MTSRRDALKSAALLPLAALPARAAPMVSGSPLAGHFTHDSVRLWMQATEEATAAVRYWPEGQEDREATAQGSLLKATECIEEVVVNLPLSGALFFQRNGELINSGFWSRTS